MALNLEFGVSLTFFSFFSIRTSLSAMKSLDGANKKLNSSFNSKIGAKLKFGFFFLAFTELLNVLKEARKELKELKPQKNLGCLLPFFSSALLSELSSFFTIEC